MSLSIGKNMCRKKVVFFVWTVQIDFHSISNCRLSDRKSVVQDMLLGRNMQYSKKKVTFPTKKSKFSSKKPYSTFPGYFPRYHKVRPPTNLMHCPVRISPQPKIVGTVATKCAPPLYIIGPWTTRSERYISMYQRPERIKYTLVVLCRP